MSWTDEEIDSIFEEASDKQTFEYRPEYWKDIEKQLPVNKTRKPLFWWITGSAFVIGFLSLFFVEMKQNDTKISLIEETNGSAINRTTKIEKTPISAPSIETAESTTSINEKSSDVLGAIAGQNLNQTSIIIQNKTISDKINTNTTNASIIENVSISNSNEDIQTHVIVQENTKDEINYVGAIESLEKYDENASLASLPVKQLIIEQITPDLVIGDLFSKKQSNSQWFVEINGALGQAWTKTEENPNAINGSLGLAGGIVLPFHKFTLTAGLGFQATKLDDLKIKERTKIYGFGSSVLENTYKINSIYAVNLPISIAHISGRHSFSLGLITSMNLFTGLSRTQTTDGYQTIYSKGVANTNLFNRFGIQPSIGYGFYINENVQIGLRANIQVLQPIQSDRFIGTPVKMPFEGQFYLKRTIKF